VIVHKFFLADRFSTSSGEQPSPLRHDTERWDAEASQQLTPHHESPIVSICFLATRYLASSIVNGAAQLRREKTFSKSETPHRTMRASLSERSSGLRTVCVDGGGQVRRSTTNVFQAREP